MHGVCFLQFSVSPFFRFFLEREQICQVSSFAVPGNTINNLTPLHSVSQIVENEHS